jgi:uncharacterized protein involved in type VI secretion and phage assembly
MSVPSLLPYVVVRLDGSEAPPEVAGLLVGLRVRDSLHLPDQAVLKFADPALERVDQSLLTVGRTLEVLYAAPGSSTATSVFSGKIHSIELELIGEGAFIAATAYEPAFALHQNRRTQGFQQMTAGDIAQKVIAGVGLTAAIDASGVGDAYPFVLQNNETDWQLLWRLAGALGYEVVGEGSTVHFRPAGSSPADAPVALAAPQQLLSFRPRVSGAQQVDSVTVRGWDPSTAEAIVATKSPSAADSTPQLDRAQVANSVGAGKWTVADRVVLSQSEADALAGSLASGLANAWIDADGVTDGDPRVRAGCQVNISGVGQRYGGTYRVTSATHSFVGGRGYTTQFVISGRSPRTLLDLVGTGQPAAAGSSSVVVGVVTQTQDPDGLGRVRVRYPALGDDVEGWWARIASPAAGAGRGLLMMPVVGDEVVLAFEQGDPRRPYVLGAVWNGNTKPGDSLVKQDGSFALASDHDVAISATGAASIAAQKKASLKGQEVSLQADNQLEVKGATVTVESDGSVTIKGSSLTIQAQGSLNLQASGAVKISGSAVMLG